jgi:N-acetylmuramoyl-L-alanine amidase
MRLLLATFILFACTMQAYALNVENVRVGQRDGGVTRVVLETDKPVKPKVFTLQNPSRVVIDMPVAEFHTYLNGIKYPPKTLIHNMRQGLFNPKTTRMVVDAIYPVSANMFTIPATKGKRFRVVVDIKRTSQYKSPKQIPIITNVEKKQTPPPVSLTPVPDRGPIIVMIDPGHGGVDPGAVKNKIYEKDIVLAIGKKLRDELNKVPGIKAYMTRDRDIFVRLSDRVKKAQQKGADLFISLHADSHKSTRVNGGSVYVLSEKSSDKEAQRLAQHANESDALGGIDISHESSDVQNILIELAQRETLNKSALLANEILSRLGRVVKLRKKNIMFAGFKVLKAPDIPSVLIELSYLSNYNDRKNLRSKQGQIKMSQSIAEGVRAYVNQHMPNKMLMIGMQ